MAEQALYRTWRSQTFDELVGQEHVTLTLRNALRAGRVAHAYLFTGPRGTGKTSTARILAKAVNCLAANVADRPCNRCAICKAVNNGSLLDLIEIDAASNRGIDEIRELREKVNFAPGEARYKVYVIDEVHMLTNEAFNALLKTLEEPPPHAIFILATTDVQKVPATVLSRCQRFDFRRISQQDTVAQLARIVESLGKEAEPEALGEIARAATGSLRDAISLLDQLFASGTDRLTVDQVHDLLGHVAEQAVYELAGHLASHDIGEGLALINQLVAEGADLRQLALQMVGHLRALLLVRAGGGADVLHLTAEAVTRLQQQAERWTTPELVRAIQLFNQAGLELRQGFHPQLPLELAFVEAATAPQASEPARPPAAPRPDAAPLPATPVPEARPAALPAPAEKPPAAAPPSETPPPTPAPADGAEAPPPATVEIVPRADARWQSVLAVIKEGGAFQTGGILNSVKDPMHIDGTTLILEFRHAFHREKLEKPEQRKLVEDAISRVWGRAMTIRCIKEGEWQPPRGAVQPAAAPPAKTTKPAAARPASRPRSAPPQDLPKKEDVGEVLNQFARQHKATVQPIPSDAETDEA